MPNSTYPTPEEVLAQEEQDQQNQGNQAVADIQPDNIMNAVETLTKFVAAVSTVDPQKGQELQGILAQMLNVIKSVVQNGNAGAPTTPTETVQPAVQEAPAAPLPPEPKPEPIGPGQGQGPRDGTGLRAQAEGKAPIQSETTKPKPRPIRVAGSKVRPASVA